MSDELKAMVFEALDNAWDGGHSDYLIHNEAANIAVDILVCTDLSDLHNVEPSNIEPLVIEWKAQKANG